MVSNNAEIITETFGSVQPISIIQSQSETFALYYTI
uniref:Uncharacterized protein n=1 Tax=Rhizophora mucronata TaxID=61149 RepID=A0A2P2QBF0_RHIMU